MDKRFFGAIGTTITFLIFFKWFPLSIMAKAPIIFSFLGALLFGYFLLRLLMDARASTTDKNKDSKKNVFFLLIIVPLVTIVMAMLFYFNFHIRQKDLLVSKGVITTGKVLEKETYKIKGEKKYRIKVAFTAADGQQYYSREEIDKKEYNKVQDKGPVSVIYYKESPNLHDLVLSDQAYRQYERAVKKMK